MSYKITIIGSGNVAWHLSQALEDAGHSIQEVYSRNIDHAKKLCAKLYDAFPTDDLDFTESEADIFLVAVSDDALESVLTDLRIPDDAIIAHTSGTRPIDVLDLLFFHKGVFYPLQTFSKQRKISFDTIPLCIEASNDDTKKILTNLAKSITKHIYYFNSEKRKVLHVAAVFACNFTNHLMAISKEICDNEEINFQILDPLISETINKALDNDPAEMQTGPAIRQDVKTLQEHLSYLKEDLDKKEIYRMLSESILKMAKDRN
ncbi:MAG: DUF2520 domain-containing protein [Cytophagaceae bacterium]|nr:DUF2520 domain-containing protein [Cytophagaceae bacterium]